MPKSNQTGVTPKLTKKRAFKLLKDLKENSDVEQLKAGIGQMYYLVMCNDVEIAPEGRTLIVDTYLEITNFLNCI